MKFGGTLSEKDYVAAQFLHLRPRPVFAFIGVFLLAAYALVLFVFPSLLTFGVAVYLVGSFLLYVPWRARRNFRQYAALSESVSVEVHPDGLRFTRKNGEGLLPWSEIRKWRRNQRLLLLYPASNIFHLLPSHFFASSEAYIEFINETEKRVGPAT